MDFYQKNKKGGNKLMKKVFNKIITLVDGSSSSKKAVKKAISIAKATNLYILALHVIQTPLTVYPSVSSMAPVIKEDMKKHGKSFLNEIKN
jgi:nucleotide-binding universal stress UspA family protein